VLKIRIVPTLLHRDFGLVKGVQFDSRRAVGSAMQAVKVYNLRGVDELVFFDVTATQQGREPDYDLVDDLADECFMPLTVGGGVRTADHVRRLLSVGADKVAVGTAAVDRPEVVGEAAAQFGSQCVVVCIDYRIDDEGRPCAWVRSGTTAADVDPVELARRVEAAGAGEIILQSIDRDGTMSGYDVDTCRRVTDAVGIPVVASGGAGTYDDMVAVLRDGGASAVAAASIFHFTEQTPAEAREHLRTSGFPVRR